MKAKELSKYLRRCPDVTVMMPDDIEGEVEVGAIWYDTKGKYLYLSNVVDRWGWHSRMERMAP